MAAPPQTLLTTLFVLALFSAYLTTGSLVTDRISPSIFFTLSICLAAATFYPAPVISAASLAASITAQCFQSIDHIHGECGYGVLWGERTWHKARLGDLAFYRQCSQPATAFWLMMIIAILWFGIFVVQIWQLYASSSKIKLPIDADEGPEGSARDSGLEDGEPSAVLDTGAGDVVIVPPDGNTLIGHWHVSKEEFKAGEDAVDIKSYGDFSVIVGPTGWSVNYGPDLISGAEPPTTETLADACPDHQRDDTGDSDFVNVNHVPLWR